jgi:hypothetical protein
MQNTASDLLTFIFTCCAARLHTASEIYWSAIRAGLNTVKPEGGMTFSHTDIEMACQAAAIRGELKRVYGTLCGCDMFRAT